jgi:hypothetical protein
MTKIKVIALYNFDGDVQNGLAFNEGDIIEVLGKSESGWWNGWLNGHIGWFPSNYVKKLTMPLSISTDLNALSMNETSSSSSGKQAKRFDSGFTDSNAKDSSAISSPNEAENSYKMVKYSFIIHFC